MKNIKNLINKEEDVLNNIDETPVIIEEEIVEHEHLHVDPSIKKEIRNLNNLKH